MSELLGSFGDSITQTVNGIFPDGGVGNLAGYAIKAANSATGGSAINHLMDGHSYLMKKIWGGVPFPGTVKIFTDKINFVPSVFIKLPIYKGIELISIPYNDVVSIDKVKKGPLKLSGIKIGFTTGEFLIMAPYDTDKIIALLERKVKINR